MKKTVSLFRFSYAAEISAASFDAQKFQTIDNMPTTEISVGWEKPVEECETLCFFGGDFVFTSMRIDRRKVPGALLAQEVQNGVDEWKKQNPDGRVSRVMKNEIKEKAKLALLAKTMPVPEHVSVVFDRKNQSGYLFTSKKSAIEEFCLLLGKTFGVGVFRSSEDDVFIPEEMPGLKIMAELSKAPFTSLVPEELPFGGQPYTLEMSGKVVFVGVNGEGETVKHSIVGPEEQERIETLVSEGKVPTTMQARLEVGDFAAKFSFDGEMKVIKSLKISNTEKEETENIFDMYEIKMLNIKAFFDVLDSCMREFANA